MPVDDSRVEEDSAAFVDASPCSTTTDTASVLSPCAGDEHTQQFSENPPSRFRKSIDSFLRNVTDTPVVGAAFEYVKDVNERSPLVRSLSGRLRPIIDIVSPVVSSAVVRLDNGIDATCRIVDQCVARSQSFPPISSETSPIINTVSTRFELTKSNVRRTITVLWTSSHNAMEDIARRKQILMGEITRRKNSLFDDLASFPQNPTIQMVMGLPSRCYECVVVSVNSRVQLAVGQARVIVSQVITYGKSWAVCCNDIWGEDPRAVLLKDFVARQYESMCLRWEMLHRVMLNSWNELSKRSLIANISRLEGAQGIVQSLAEPCICKSKELMLMVPEQKRITAFEVNTKLFAVFRRYIGDKQADYVLDRLRSALQVPV